MWGEMLRLAIRLGVAPDAFWDLSLREWRWLTETPSSGMPLARPELENLMEAWPDD